MKAELIEKNNETEDIISFLFKPSEKLEWKAGQFIYYKIPHKDPDNRGIIRHFTISSAPHEGDIRLTTRFTTGGGSSFKKALKGLRVGDEVEVFSLEGSFIIENPASKFVFIAGGIGITPFRAILLDLAYKKKIGNIYLFYDTGKENMVFKDFLEELSNNSPGLSVEYVFSPQKVDYRLLQRKISDLEDRLCFISGPMMMIKEIRNSIIEGGVPGSKIKADFFSGY